MRAASYPVSYTHLDVYKRQNHLLERLNPHQVQPVTDNLPDSVGQIKARRSHFGVIVEHDAQAGIIIAEIIPGVESRRDIGKIESNPVWLARRCRRFDDPRELSEQFDQAEFMRCLLYTSRCV